MLTASIFFSFRSDVTASRATSAPDLKFSVSPAQEMFIKGAELSQSLSATPSYCHPYDVDMVNGELFPNHGEGVYVVLIDTVLVNGWANFLPPTANIRTDLGKG